MKTNTVNVIEYTDDSVLSVRAFVDNPEGNQEAEALFLKCMEENTAHWSDFTEEEKAACIEEALFEEGGYQLFLAHSS